MTQKELLEMLDYFDSLGFWAFKLNHIRMYFKNEDNKSLQVALNRHTKNKIIQQCTRGVYVNPRGKKPLFPLEHLAGFIRNRATFYLSLETALSEYGLISQIPNRLTFISKNKSKVFNTPYGIIEFTYSKRNAKDFLKKCFYDKDRKIYVASEEQAVDDLYRHNRNVGLYEEQLERDLEAGFKELID